MSAVQLYRHLLKLSKKLPRYDVPRFAARGLCCVVATYHYFAVGEVAISCCSSRRQPMHQGHRSDCSAGVVSFAQPFCTMGPRLIAHLHAQFQSMHFWLHNMYVMPSQPLCRGAAVSAGEHRFALLLHRSGLGCLRRSGPHTASQMSAGHLETASLWVHPACFMSQHLCCSSMLLQAVPRLLPQLHPPELLQPLGRDGPRAGGAHDSKGPRGCAVGAEEI